MTVAELKQGEEFRGEVEGKSEENTDQLEITKKSHLSSKVNFY